MNKIFFILIQISLKFFLMDPIQYRSTLVQGAIMHQAIAWTNVDQDPSNHMASIGQKGLTHCDLVIPYGDIDINQHWLR